MDWEELVAEFRSLGGVADNVTLGEGRLGRGLFAIDPAKPVELRTPENLLVHSEDVEIRDGQLVAKSSADLGDRERGFFDRYQRHFCWGSGVFEQLWQAQQHWHELPLDLMTAVRRMGAVDYFRFAAPNNEVCLRYYINSRALRYQDARYLAPMVEFANHSGMSQSFLVGSGVAIRGMFKGEVLVRYNHGDTWQMITGYGFADAACFAHSLPISMNFQGYRIKIGRKLFEFEVKSGVMFPRLAIDKDIIQLSFLNLGMCLAPRLPQSVFYRLMSKIPIHNPDELFDRIQHYNRIQFITLLRKSNSHNGKIISLLRESALNQLEALSSCFGTRALDNESAESGAVDSS
ncbi:MAG: hypothetical protein JO081_03040 [Alphaproteobacteria bacterium]|nr:hypothetical protein [Alphaproteobacteria bacterium]